MAEDTGMAVPNIRDMLDPEVKDDLHDIFGGDSELSELESEAGDARGQDDIAEPEESASEGEDAARGEGGRGDGEYQDKDNRTKADKAADAGKKPKEKSGKPRKKRNADSDGEAPARKKRARKQQVERELSPEEILTPEEQRKRDLDKRLDAIIKKPKTKKKKRAGDEEDIGGAADEEEVLRLRADMLGAVKRDLDANADGKPAVHKLRMLPQVTATLQKQHLELVALDQGILGAIKEWLEPLGDRSLPALNILRALFSILLNLTCDAASLKESGIGKVILFYSRCERCDASIRRTADLLITNWMRPLLRRSATWRDRPIQTASSRDDARELGHPTATSSQRTRLASIKPAFSDSATVRRHARIPQASTNTYTIAPRSMDVDSGSQSYGQSKEQSERFREFSRKLKMNKSANKNR